MRCILHPSGSGKAVIIRTNNCDYNMALVGAKIKLFSDAFLAYLALVFGNRRFCTQLAWKCNPHEKKKCKTLKIASLFQLTSHDLAQILRNRFGCLPKLDLDHEHVETITQRPQENPPWCCDNTSKRLIQVHTTFCY